jgi:uncharacterized protein (DUF2336 family)
MDYLRSFPALEGLVNLGNRDDIDISPTLLRVLTDLYVTKQRHSIDEERQFTELVLRLLDVVDVSARHNLALRLASYAQAPLPVVQRLARDVIAVAEPILRQSPCLTPADLLAIVQNMGPGHVAAIAAREGFETLTQARESELTIDPFAGNEAAASELSELFFAANATERRLILLNLDYAPLPPAKTLMLQLAREAIRRLEAAALGHNVETFARELARAMAISRKQAQRLTDDASGEPIVVVAKALGMPDDVLQRILLCLNPAISESIERVYALANLNEELKLDAALRMVAIWQTMDHERQSPSHRPQLWNDEARPRPDVTVAARRSAKIGSPDQRTGTKRT